MTKKREDYFQELSNHFVWDPEDNGKDYKVEHDESKFRHVVKRFLKELHPTSYDSIEKAFGDTVYKALAFDKMPGLNQVVLLHGGITAEEFADLYTKDLDVRGKYPFFSDNGEDIFNKTTEALAALYKEHVEGPKTVGSEDTVVLTPLTGAALTAVDSLLTSAGNPSFADIVNEFGKVHDKATSADASVKEMQAKMDKAMSDLGMAQEQLRDANLAAIAKPVEFKIDHDGTIPEGHTVEKKASEVFEGIDLPTDFTLTAWEWEGPHPDVPEIDEHYIFRPKELARVLLALVTNRRAYLHGHTGSGKTTLLEQVAARLNWPFARINFDSEITRMDLIGRDTLVNEEGKTVSKFVDGILPRVMSGPYLTCFDELDFARPDVAYVMQAALEGNSLRITEDGDRLVTPHPYFRMFGTGNTVGQGDEHGMYAGARVQSMAFMNRFSIFAHIDYLSEEARSDLVKRHYPGLSADHHKQLMKYVTEHLKAFTGGEVSLPISPRGMLSAALTTLLMGDLKEALSITFLDGASDADRGTLSEIVNRVAS